MNPFKLTFPDPSRTSRPDVPIADAYVIDGADYEIVDADYFLMPMACDVEPDESVTPLHMLWSIDHGVRTADETSALIGINSAAEVLAPFIRMTGGDPTSLDWWGVMCRVLDVEGWSGGWLRERFHVDELPVDIYEWSYAMESAASSAGLLIETSADSGMTWGYVPTSEPIDAAVRFFWQHAGYSYRPDVESDESGRLRGARELAAAEAWARANGVTFSWRDDWEVAHETAYDCYDEGEPETCELCTALDGNGAVLASLGCIDDATDDYRRVVEAELALEAMSAPVGPRYVYDGTRGDWYDTTIPAIDVDDIPADWPVQPAADGETTCGYCHLSWHDDVSTSMTPVPSGRCPFETFHHY